MFVRNMFVHTPGMAASKKKVAAPASRRERPAKAALTRQGIIDVALGIVRDEGLEKVTMRRIAAALDTGPAALYVYLRDTEDLHAQILDALLAPLRPSKAGRGTWRDRLKALLTRYSRVLFDHPEMARMAMSTQPSGPSYMALVDAILALLREGGVPDREAAWAVDLLLLYTTALAAERSHHRASPRAAADFSAMATAISTADAARYPNIARLGGELLSGEGPDRFNWALDVILQGSLTTSRSTTKKA
jgi:AcrR family transcriptional regulator